jgi:hypothetical protein
VAIEIFAPGNDTRLESNLTWNFPGDAGDYPFYDLNFRATIAKENACEREKTRNKDIYVADLIEKGGAICRSW